MSEQSITDLEPHTDAPSPDEPAEFDLDSWIAGLSGTERSVEIYGNTTVFGRYEHLVRELQIEEQVVAETSVDDGGRIAALRAEIDELYEQQQASKTTWYLQALDSDLIREITAEHPVPDLPPKPVEPAKNAPDPVKARYAAEVKKWEKKNAPVAVKRAAAVNERNLHLIAAAVVRVVDRHDRVVTTTVTAEQLRAIESKPHGALQVGRLLQAAMSAKAEEPTIAAPFWHASSKGALT